MSGALESWRPIPGFPDYLVSDLGRIMRVAAAGNNFARPGRIVNPQVETNGYLRVNLFGAKGPKRRSVHAVVCEAFHGPKPSPKHEVAHGDGDKTNNRPENLRWATRSENHADKWIHGTAQVGERNPNSRWTDAEIALVRDESRPLKQVADELGMNYNYAWAIRNGRVRQEAA